MDFVLGRDINISFYTNKSMGPWLSGIMITRGLKTMIIEPIEKGCTITAAEIYQLQTFANPFLLQSQCGQ